METNNKVTTEPTRTKGKFFIDKGDSLEEYLLRLADDDGQENFDVCSFACDETENTEANAEFICKAVNEYDKLKADNEALNKLLCGLTPGGSEFVNDPEYCAKYMKEFGRSQHEFIISLIVEKKQLIDQKAELLGALKELNNYWGSGNFSRDPDLWNRIKETIQKADQK